MMSPLEIINFVIDVFEGGATYTDAPGDLGGATKFGITRPFLARAWGRPVSKADIRNLTREEAVEAYRVLLIEQARLGRIRDWRVLFAVFDFAVNAGEDDAIPALQRALGVTADGIIGPQTQRALEQADGQLIAWRVVVARQAFHIRRSYAPEQAQWLRGWMNRCTRLAQEITAEASPAWRPPMDTRPRGGYASQRDRLLAARRRKRSRQR